MTPRRTGKRDRTPANNGATLGFEKRMWEAADALRGSMDAADSFEEHRARLEAERASGADPEDPEPFEEKMKRLTAQLREQTAEARRLDRAIAANLKHLGFPLDDK